MMKIGCNYWASHAGTRMWELWDEDVVRGDFKRLAELGCGLVRVFPNWRDFQPVEAVAGFRGSVRSLQMRGHALPDTPCGHAGVDEEMLRRFRRLAEIAEENRIELVVALVTGWMSGCLFLPPALEKLNPLSDPLSIKWQVLFVRCFVRELKDCAAIRCWELGNECNCMGTAEDPSVAWNWTNAIASAIRLEDPERPVASGMHGLMPGEDLPGDRNCWSIQTQGELCDLMTAHPYPHSPSKLAARVDPHNSIRTAFQAAVEMLFYSDIGRRPGAVEEIGTFSPSYCAEKEKAEFIRNSLYNAWAHGAEYFLWWCAFDQSGLPFPPYEWSAWERELGFFTPSMQEKPVAETFREFRKFLDGLPFGELPPFRRDAVCLLTREQDFDQFMSNGWSAFLLAKQNGFDIRFQYCMDSLEDAELYIVPGLRGAGGLYKSCFDALLEKVKNGATLYISLDDGALAPFESVFGVEVGGREARTAPARVLFGGEVFELESPFRLSLRNINAEILAAEEDGNPVFLRSRFGKGEVYLLTLPLERDLAGRPGAFHKEQEPSWRGFYREFSRSVTAKRLLRSASPLVTLTEHPDPGSPDVCWCVVVNNGPSPVRPELRLASGWRPAEPVPELAPFSGEVIQLIKAMGQSF